MLVFATAKFGRGVALKNSTSLLRRLALDDALKIVQVVVVKLLYLAAVIAAAVAAV